MRIYYHWREMSGKYDKPVVGLGNFDGVHIGHQKLIEEVKALAGEIGGTPALITFQPHPMAVIQPDSCPPLLLPKKYKEKLIADLQIEVLLQLTFDREFAMIPPEDFIKEILYEGLGAKGVVVGFNFTFGRFGQGTPELLQELAPVYGYKLVVVPPVRIRQEAVSSSLIRETLLSGQVVQAAEYLGYHPFAEGTVVSGDKRGASLGYPTANISIGDNALIPANGVYSVIVDLGGKSYPGLANVGQKPTFNGKERLIETHLLDFSRDIYGQEIKVRFIDRIREEKRFSSSEELVKQIEKDIALARDKVNVL